MINKLVSELPEIYQPIYGYEELSANTSRTCIDRLDHILRIYDSMEKVLNRPLKVLDLGCAQGFFSLNLGARGAIVTGVDFLDKNIAVCNALLAEHQKINADFKVDRIENIISSLEHGYYDLVIGLSVFHHIIHEHGLDVVKEMLTALADKTQVMIFELALRSESLYWSNSLPENPLDLLENIAFVHEVTTHSTHLTEIARPFVVASQFYWIVNDHAEKFESRTLEPHSLAHNTHQNSRHYYFNDTSILKYYKFDHCRGSFNKQEFYRELNFLNNAPVGFIVPNIITSYVSDKEAWIAIERLPGQLLLDVLSDGKRVDHHEIILSILKQLTILEGSNLYHNDVRAWNILVQEDRIANLIDYGSISSEEIDCTWPGNLFFSFFMFVKEVYTHNVDDPNPLRTISISPENMPDEYKNWARNMWNKPLLEWSFKVMYETLLTSDNILSLVDNPRDLWAKAVEDAVQVTKQSNRHLELRVNDIVQKITEFESIIATTKYKAQQAESKAQQAESKAQQAESKAHQAENKAHQAENKAHQAENKAQQAENKAERVEVQAQQAEIKAEEEKARTHHFEHTITEIYASRSWRITYPMRWSFHQARLLREHGLKSRSKSLLIKLAKPVLNRAFHYVDVRPNLRRKLLGMVHRLGFYTRFKSLYHNRHHEKLILNQPVCNLESNVVQGNLSPREKQIYSDLKKSIIKNQEFM